MPYEAARRRSTAKSETQSPGVTPTSGGGAETALLGLQQSAGNAATTELLSSVAPRTTPQEEAPVDLGESEDLRVLARSYIESALGQLADGNRLVEQALDATGDHDTWPMLLGSAAATVFGAVTYLEVAAETRQRLAAQVPVPAPPIGPENVDHYLAELLEAVTSWQQDLEVASRQGAWDTSWDTEWMLRINSELPVPTWWLEESARAEPALGEWAAYLETMGGAPGR
jgi:hypothetical protein